MFTRKIRNRGLLLAAFFALALNGCGRDKNVEEYQREKLQQNLGLYQSVAGMYTGVVRSKLDGRVIGAMQLELRAETRTRDSSDGQMSVGTPVLVGNIRFLDRVVVNVSAPNGFYDPATGLYSADITITRSTSTQPGGGGGGTGGVGGTPGAPGNPSNQPGSPVNPSSETITISGQLRDGSLRGELQSLNYPEYGGRFELLRGGRDIRRLLNEARPGGSREDDDRNKATSYSGSTTFQNGVSKPVHLVLIRQTYNTAEDILDLLSPVKYVQASLNYSETLHLLFSRAVFDTRQGYMTAQTTLSVDGQLQQMTMDCHSQGEREMYCTHLTSGGGVAATTRAQLNNGMVKDPPDSPQNRQSITKTFVGRGYFTPNDYRKMKLVVTYPARSRLSDLLELFFPITERFVQASIIFSENTSASFINVKWDTVNGLLDGSLEGKGTGSYVAQIQCHNFFFTQTRDPFSCQYWTNRSPAITINFTPPFKK